MSSSDFSPQSETTHENQLSKLRDAEFFYPTSELNFVIPDTEHQYNEDILLIDRNKFEQFFNLHFRNKILTPPLFFSAQEGIKQIKDKLFNDTKDIFSTYDIQPSNFFIIESCQQEFLSYSSHGALSKQLPALIKELHTTQPEPFILQENQSGYFKSYDLVPHQYISNKCSVLCLISKKNEVYLTSVIPHEEHPITREEFLYNICKPHILSFFNRDERHLAAYLPIDLAARLLDCSQQLLLGYLKNGTISSRPNYPNQIPLYELLDLIRRYPDNFSVQLEDIEEQLERVFFEEYQQAKPLLHAKKSSISNEDEPLNYTEHDYILNSQLSYLFENEKNKRKEAELSLTNQKNADTLESSIRALIEVIETSQNAITCSHFHKQVQANANAPSNLNKSLIKKIFQMLPQKYRAKRGESPHSK